jgi:hypothetical protein
MPASPIEGLSNGWAQPPAAAAAVAAAEAAAAEAAATWTAVAASLSTGGDAQDLSRTAMDARMVFLLVSTTQPLITMSSTIMCAFSSCAQFDGS